MLLRKMYVKNFILKLIVYNFFYLNFKQTIREILYNHFQYRYNLSYYV